MKFLKSILVIIILFTQDVISEPLIKFSAAQIQSIDVGINLNSRIIQGHHKITDEAGNDYYYVNNADIGNPTTSGYGNFKVYYKNGHNWEYTFGDEKREGVMYFMTLNETVKDIKKGSVVFCIQPIEEAEWIDDTNQSNSFFNELSTAQQQKVSKSVSLAISEFSKTGNFDYLVAGQMLVWEAVGAKFTSFDNSVKMEKDNLNKKLKAYDTLPSFSGQSIELTYNPSNKRYEASIKDNNNVLDQKYLNNLVGQYDEIHIEDGKDDNDLYIWTQKEINNEMLISATYNPIPNEDGTKLGIYYNTDPKFVNSGQDLVTGLSYDDIFSFSIKLDLVKGKAHLKKCGYNIQGTCEPLKDSTFGLYDKKDNLIEQKNTNSNGEITFENISLGDYYIKEIKAPNKYELNNTKYEFSITKDNQVIKINNGKYIENKLIKGKVKLTKVGQVNNNDNNLYPLKGVEFTIYKDLNKNSTLDEEELNYVVQKLYTNEEGIILSDYLEYGNYIIKETSPLEGYINGGYVEAFSILQNEQVIELYGGVDLENELIKGKIDLYKTSDINYKQCRSSKMECLTNENLLQGVRFVIYEDKNNNKQIDKEDTKIQTLTTNDNGYAISSYLNYGNYILKEEQTIPGYEMTEDIYPFSITKNNQLIHINDGNPIINSAKKFKVQITKEDEKGNKIKDVKFGIYEDSNKNGVLDKEEEKDLVDEVITDENGYAQSNDLNFGYYILKEIEAPKQYIIEQRDYPFIIDDNTKENIKIKVINKLKKGIIKIVKKDNNNNLLQGALFEIYYDENNNKQIDEKDKKVKQISTNNLGEAIVEDLVFGQYLIKEIKAPKGYKLSNKLFIVNINEQKEYELEVYNQKIPEHLVITSQNIWKCLVLIISLLAIVSLIYYKKNCNKGNYI